MAQFGRTSQKRLDTCHEEFKIVMPMVIAQLPYTCPVNGVTIVDCGIICGYRDEESQIEAFRSGASNAKFGQSKHNTSPSEAVDSLPMAEGKYLWSKRKYEAYHRAYAKLVLDTAWGQGFKWRAGIEFKSIYDAPHFERIE